MTDITTGASSIAGKVSPCVRVRLSPVEPGASLSHLQVTDVVHKKGGLDLSSLWGTTRAEYLPCEDSGLLQSSAG